MKKIYFLAVTLLSVAIAHSQNVGIGTNDPKTKLDINGALSQRITDYVPGATITIAANIGIARITENVTTPQANVITVTSPQIGQFLTVVNEDNDAATLNGYTIPAGTPANPSLGNFVYVGGATPGWRQSSNNNTGANSFNAGSGLSWSGNTLNSVWTANGSNDIYNNNASSKVGIGTNSPSGTLDVQGGSAASGNNGNNIRLKAQNAGTGNNNGGALDFTSGDGTGTGNGGNITISSGAGGGSGNAGTAFINPNQGDVRIATGTATGNVTIGNAGNNVNLPKLNASSIVRTDAAKNLTTGAVNLNSSDVTGILPAGNLPDATTSAKGIVQLAGDLTGTATSPQIAAGAIVDADVNASAAIARSKIAAGTANHIVVNDGSGNLSSSATVPVGNLPNLAGDVTGAITSNTIANNAVTSGKILDGTITNADLANSTITVNATAGQGVTVSGSPVALGGTLTVGSNGTSSNTASTIVMRDASGNFNAGLVTADLHGHWRAIDDRIIAPADITSGSARFGFTSWDNNNTAPYADFLHLRSYTDASGGLDNLVMFKKSGIGMRIFQQAWNSGTAYSSFKDVAFEQDVATGYIQNQNTGPQTNSNFWLSGGGTFGSSSPLTFTSIGAGVFNRAVVYNDATNGLLIERARVSDASNAAITDFNINQRGGGNPAFIVKGTGNVGIGTTTSPSSLLHVNVGNISNSNSATAGILVSGDATGNAGYMGTRYTLNNSTANYAGFVRAVRTSGTTYIGLEVGSETNHGIRFLTNGTADANERMRVDNAGNVGIGTSSPAASLDVGGTAASGALRTVFARQTEGNNTGSGTFLGVRAWGTQTNSYSGKMFSIENTFYGDLNSSMEFYRGGSTTGGFMTFTTNNGTERMRIQADGNVGIGTTSAVTNLHVSGSAASAISVSSSNYPTTYKTQLGAQSSAQGILVFGNNGTNEIRFGNTAAGGSGTIYTNNTADYNATTTGNLAMHFKSDASIGVGTASPVGKFHIFAGGAGGVGWSTGFNVGDLTNYTGFIQDGGVARWRNFGTGGYDWYSSGGSQRMILTDGGSLGIGVSPGATLDVNGNVRIRGGSPAANKVLVSTDGNGTAVWSNSLSTKPATSTFTVGGSTSTFYPVIFTDAAWDDGPMELEINRSNVHQDYGSWGALQSKFRSHATNWGHGANFIDAEIYYSVQPFIARYEYVNERTDLIIWLRGGTTYTTRSNNTTVVADYSATSKNISYPPYYNYTFSPQSTVESYVTAGKRFTGNLTITGKFKSTGISETSDSTYKTNIEVLTNALQKVKELRGVSYNWKTDEYPDMNFEREKQLGLIAQEVEKILPEVVETDHAGLKSVEYGHIVPLLIEALKEQQNIIQSQQQQLKSITTSTENRFTELEDKIARLSRLLEPSVQK